MAASQHNNTYALQPDNDSRQGRQAIWHVVPVVVVNTHHSSYHEPSDAGQTPSAVLHLCATNPDKKGSPYEPQIRVRGAVVGVGACPDCHTVAAETYRFGAGEKKLNNNQCALCHGIDDVGGKGHALNQPKPQHAPTLELLLKVIQQGIPGTEMPDFRALNDEEARQVAAYVRSLGRLKPVKLPGNAARGHSFSRRKAIVSLVTSCAGQAACLAPS